jgi:hypothetical protein
MGQSGHFLQDLHLHRDGIFCCYLSSMPGKLMQKLAGCCNVKAMVSKELFAFVPNTSQSILLGLYVCSYNTVLTPAAACTHVLDRPSLYVCTPIMHLSDRFIFECLTGVRQEGCFGAVLCDGMGLGKTFQTVASLWCLLTKGIDGRPTCKKPLVLCPSSLVQNWGKEFGHWLGDRVQPVVVDETKAPAVKASLQASTVVQCIWHLFTTPGYRSVEHDQQPALMVSLPHIVLFADCLACSGLARKM